MQGLRSSVPYLSADAPAQSRSRDAALPWRAWYKTARWQKLRWQVVLDAAFTCAFCGRVGTSPEVVADHIRPHKGNAALFWARDNLQCLCKGCHDTVKQSAERGGIKTLPPPTP